MDSWIKKLTEILNNEKEIKKEEQEEILDIKKEEIKENLFLINPINKEEEKISSSYSYDEKKGVFNVNESFRNSNNSNSSSNSITENINIEVPKRSKRRTQLTEIEEYELALCSAEIFMKKEEERSLEEKAYVVAMKQYYNKLDKFNKKIGKNIIHEHSLGKI
jgi:hypothetical protein